MSIRTLLEKIEARTKTGVLLRVLPGGAGAEPEAAAPDKPEVDLVPDKAPKGKAMRVGDTVEVNGMRIHRYDPSLEVTDLSNAGKRGKLVRRFSLYDYDMMRDAEEAVEHLVASIAGARNFEAALSLAKYAVQEATRVGQPLRIEERSLRGVDVKPAQGAPGAEIKIDTPTFELRASAVDFHVFERRPDKDPDTDNIIPPHWGAKKAAIRDFYTWVRTNEAEIRKMTFRELGKALSDADLAYHRYATLD
jgi:hypothetical protein